MKLIYKKILSFLSLILILASCHDEHPLEAQIDFGITVESPEEDVDMQTVLENFLTEGESNFRKIRDYEIYDEANDVTRLYDMMLPRDIDANKSYRVLYLLHGRDSNRKSWCDDLKLLEIADYFYKKGLDDLIVVLPDAGNSYYVDGYQSGVDYETFFIRQFIPYIENLFNIDGDKGRYVGGLSMGGYGATYYTFKYPGLFSYCHCMSAPFDGNGNPLTPSLVKILNPTSFEVTPWLVIDIGNRDSFVKVNLEAHLALYLLGFPHDFNLREGGHNKYFWRESLYYLFENLFESAP